MQQGKRLTVGPDLVENQMSGSVNQATSRVLYEQMPFTKTRVTGIDWVTRPILRFKEHPNVTTVLMQRTDLSNQGAGESLSPTPPPAITNALFDATGVRVREAPLTPTRVRAAFKAAGVA
jgi:CO/xanthine dehydrogenase Mo-binding subunit